MKKLKVLYLGNFNPETYTRGQVIIKGLQKNGIDVDVCTGSGVKGYLKIVKRLLQINYNYIISTGKLVLLVSILFKILHKKKVIFDVFISDYENLVLNRKIVNKNSIKAKLLWFLDKYCCEISDINILDTTEHIDYFCDTYNLKHEKFKEVLIGCDEGRFYPRILKTHNSKFKVLFFGSFIPGHGIDIILQTAKRLKNKKNINIDFIGTGQLFNEMKNLSKKLDNKNVNFIGWVPQKKLPLYISKYDLCLGLFDNNIPKVKRVIPTKVFEITAMKRPLITGENDCVKRYLIHEENCLLCKMGSAEDLEKKILQLYNNEALLKKISNKGYLLFKKKFSSSEIGKSLKKILLTLE